MIDLKTRILRASQSLPDIAPLLKTGMPKTGIILGSGLQAVTDMMEISHTIPFSQIEGLCPSTAPSHEGALLFGGYPDEKGNMTPVIVCQGRVHLYEGYSPIDVTMPVYLMAALGAENLVVTNAAGGLNPDYKPGSVVMISDHINLTGMNPLIAINEPDIGVRFPDMSRAYNPDIRAFVKGRADTMGLNVHEGIYVGVTGPSLETSAERRFFRQCGGDLIGMSTVMEVIAANHCSMNVLGLSVVTNSATGGPEQQPDSIEEVLAYAKTGGDKISQLLTNIIGEL